MPLKTGIFRWLTWWRFLTESAAPRNYWKVLKNRLKKEGNQTVTNCNSRPFEIPTTGRIAAKIINHLGDEVMKVFAVN